jgi:hypothetical protein
MISLKSRSRALAGVFFAISILLAGTDAGSSAGEGSGDPQYVTYVGCARYTFTSPSHLCRKGDPVGAFFESKQRDVVYTACAEFPTGNKACSPAHKAETGTLYVNKITDTTIGRTFVTWYVEGQGIGTWEYGLYPSPVVSEFGINPLFISKKHRLVGLLIRHGSNASRVRAWITCGTHNTCPLRFRFTGKHDGVRRYVVSSPPGGANFRLGATLFVLLDAPGKTDGHGSRIWGRLYAGRFVRARHGGPGDTALRHQGPLRCVMPGESFRQAVGCWRVP